MQGNIDITGTVDIHGHCGPSKFARRVDGYEFAMEAAEASMDAIVLKEHHLPTVYGIPYIDRLLEHDGYDIEVIGSMVMNYCNGGFNPFMVQTAIDYGAGVIWAPTIDAKNHGDRTNGVGLYLDMEEVNEEYEGKEGLYALNDDGDLLPDVELCLRKIAENDVVFSIGHLTYEETLKSIEYLADLGHEKIVLDHPNYYITQFDCDQQKELVNLGAVVNFQFASLSPKFHWQDPVELADNIRALGVDNVALSSDMGQVANPSAPEGFRILGELLLEQGFSKAEYQTIAEENPKRLLGLA